MSLTVGLLSVGFVGYATAAPAADKVESIPGFKPFNFSVYSGMTCPSYDESFPLIPHTSCDVGRSKGNPCDTRGRGDVETKGCVEAWTMVS